MGLYEREYAKESTRAPVLVRNYSALEVLIGINIAVFLLWLGMGRASDFMHEHFVFSVSNAFEHWRLHTLLTANISHMELFHILFNMLFLWWFGKELELVYGPRNFLWMYVACGLLSSLAYGALSAVGWIPGIGCLGASGSVIGIVVCCACIYPDRPAYFMWFIPMPLKWLAVLYVGLDFVQLLDRERPDGVAHAAHLGGALGGYLFYKFDWRLFGSHGDRPQGFWVRVRQFFRGRPKLRVVERRPEPEEPWKSPAANPAHVDAETSARVDALLKKISEHGIGALTGEERAFLEASSSKYRK